MLQKLENLYESFVNDSPDKRPVIDLVSEVLADIFKLRQASSKLHGSGEDGTASWRTLRTFGLTPTNI
jgi:hypothetical protein